MQALFLPALSSLIIGARNVVCSHSQPHGPRLHLQMHRKGCCFTYVGPPALGQHACAAFRSDSRRRRARGLLFW